MSISVEGPKGKDFAWYRIFSYVKYTFCIYNISLKINYSVGTAHPSGAPEFIPVYSGVQVVRSLTFCVIFCRLLFVLFPLVIVLSVLLRFTNSDYPFGIFKLFFKT